MPSGVGATYGSHTKAAAGIATHPAGAVSIRSGRRAGRRTTGNGILPRYLPGRFSTVDTQHIQQFISAHNIIYPATMNWLVTWYNDC